MASTERRFVTVMTFGRLGHGVVHNVDGLPMHRAPKSIVVDEDGITIGGVLVRAPAAVTPDVSFTSTDLTPSGDQ